MLPEFSGFASEVICEKRWTIFSELFGLESGIIGENLWQECWSKFFGFVSEIKCEKLGEYVLPEFFEFDSGILCENM